MECTPSRDKLADTVVGVIFWISAWQLVQLLTDHLPKKKKILIFTALVVITILILAAIYTRRVRPVPSESSSSSESDARSTN